MGKMSLLLTWPLTSVNTFVMSLRSQVLVWSHTQLQLQKEGIHCDLLHCNLSPYDRAMTPRSLRAVSLIRLARWAINEAKLCMHSISTGRKVKVTRLFKVFFTGFDCLLNRSHWKLKCLKPLKKASCPQVGCNGKGLDHVTAKRPCFALLFIFL